MPIFEYECRGCGARFEELVLNNQTEILCRKCGSSQLSQLLSTFAVSAGADRGAAEPGPCGACGAPVRGSCTTD